MKTAPRLLLLFAVCLAGAAHAVDLRAERARIAAEDRVVEQRFAVRQRECESRFVVTSCLNAAKRDRRDAQDRLRRQRDVLDETDRKQRAADRIDEVKLKREEQAQRQPPRSPGAHSFAGMAASGAASSPSVAASMPSRHASSPGRQRAPREPSHRAVPKPGMATTRAQAAERVQAADNRASEMEAPRQASDERNARRSAKAKAVKPLPVPSGVAP